MRYVRVTSLELANKTLPYLMRIYFSDLPLFLALWRGHGRPNGSTVFNVHCTGQSGRTVLVKDECVRTDPDKNIQES